MLTDMQAAGARMIYQPSRREPASLQETRAFPLEPCWRQPSQRATTTPDDITISLWTYTQTGIRHEDATTPARWRCASRNASASPGLSDPASTAKTVAHVLPVDFL